MCTWLIVNLQLAETCIAFLCGKGIIMCHIGNVLLGVLTKGPGLKLQSRPKVRNAFLGMIAAQPTPRGYATSWTTIEVIVKAGALRENNALSPDAIVTSNMPSTHARMVFAGRSSS